MPKIRWHDEADHIIVGSGAAGATASVTFAEAGKSVIVLEEGDWFRTPDFSEDMFLTIATLFRDYGMQSTSGTSIIPIIQGRCVGGSTVMNGAIVHQLPEHVHERWCEDPPIRTEIPFSRLDTISKTIKEDLSVRRNLQPVLEKLPVADTLKELGWSYQPMERNAPGCQATGRCLQGCPSGGKWSMESSYLPRAVKAGARILTQHRVIKVLFEGKKAVGVLCKLQSGEKRQIRARRGVTLAAGVVHTPQILWQSNLGTDHAQIGKHFQCHLSVGIVGLLPRSIELLQGPPQGVEILQFHSEGVKLATQLLPPEILLARTPAVGKELVSLLEQWNRLASWTASIQSEARGVIVPSLFGKPIVKFSATSQDLEKVRYSLWRLAQLLFKMGATRIFPGICGNSHALVEIQRQEDAHGLLSLALDPKNYLITTGHLFGGCCLSSDPKRGVVGMDFGVHGRKNLSILDASIFPSNIGVNPQHSIMTLARFGAERILEC